MQYLRIVKVEINKFPLIIIIKISVKVDLRGILILFYCSTQIMAIQTSNTSNTLKMDLG